MFSQLPGIRSIAVLAAPDQGGGFSDRVDEPQGTLTTSVYGQLRADILNGRLHPGEKLRAEALRQRFNTGSSPVREALNRLLSEGFVVLEEQKGFRVAQVSRQEFSELINARCWIDGAAIRDAIEHFETRWEEELVLALHRLSRIPRGEPNTAQSAEWEALHKAFHTALVRGCDNQWIVRISQQLFDAAERYRLLALDYVLECNELEEHRALVDACINRDAERAVMLLEQHYSQTLHAIEDSGTSS